MSTLVEEKIISTHRLERDGRWKIASRYRHRRRLEMRDGGKSKSESRESAWNEMALKFQPIDEDWRRLHLTAACLPSSFVPYHLLWRFRNAWSATMQLLAFLGSQDEALRETDLLQTYEQRLALDYRYPRATGNEETLRFLVELYTPYFLDDLETELKVVFESLDEDKPGVSATREELELVIGMFPQLRDAAEVFWPHVSEIDG